MPFVGTLSCVLGVLCNGGTMYLQLLHCVVQSTAMDVVVVAGFPDGEAARLGVLQRWCALLPTLAMKQPSSVRFWGSTRICR